MINLNSLTKNQIYNYFIVLLATLVIFREVCTYFIIIFIIYNVVQKNIEFKNYKKFLVFILIIATPFLINILFFWNNSSFNEGIKRAENTFSLLLFPILFFFNKHKLNYHFIIEKYAKLSTILISFFILRFIIIYNEKFTKYLNGIDVYEMGYKIAESIGIHAPALNMHLVFISSINFYLIFYKKYVKKSEFIFSIFIYLLSFCLILLINTRLAILLALISYAIIFIYYIFQKEKISINTKKLLLYLSILIGSLMLILYVFNKKFPYYKEKFTSVTFVHFDKIGKLDEVENPDAQLSNALVTRISIWKATFELANQKKWFGFGATDAREELIKYYAYTNQDYLERNKYPPHNQVLDYYLKFGILGIFVVLLYLFHYLYWSIKDKNPLIMVFFIMFFLENMVDDFLVRFDGIVFSSFWICIFIKNHFENSYKN